MTMIFTYTGDEAVVFFLLIGRNVCVIRMVENLINRSKQFNSRFKLFFWIIRLSFCRDKSNVFALWCYVVSVWATEQVPTKNKKGYVSTFKYVFFDYDLLHVWFASELLLWKNDLDRVSFVGVWNRMAHYTHCSSHFPNFLNLKHKETVLERY